MTAALGIARARVRRLIEAARRVEAMTEAIAATTDATTDRDDAGRWLAALAMYYESPTRRALLVEVERFTPDECCVLVALMWLGRADRGETAADWDALLAEAQRVSPDGDLLLLAGQNRLSRFLEDGLARLEGAAARS
ncbi:MAG: DUF3775 domain-containing protein [Alphaproteobacteria bacterium]|nr:DUF3775 domain-containing protein [Alphaproteobacteria bacterium]